MKIKSLLSFSILALYLGLIAPSAMAMETHPSAEEVLTALVQDNPSRLQNFNVTLTEGSSATLKKYFVPKWYEIKNLDIQQTKNGYVYKFDFQALGLICNSVDKITITLGFITAQSDESATKVSTTVLSREQALQNWLDNMKDRLISLDRDSDEYKQLLSSAAEYLKTMIPDDLASARIVLKFFNETKSAHPKSKDSGNGGHLISYLMYLYEKSEISSYVQILKALRGEQKTKLEQEAELEKNTKGEQSSEYHALLEKIDVLDNADELERAFLAEKLRRLR